MKRDFTYIDDIVEGVSRVIDKPAIGNDAWSGESPLPGSSLAPYKIYNIGNNRPENLMDFIEALEQKIGKSAKKELKSLQPGDVAATWADTEHLTKDFGYEPDTPIETGISHFVDWYRWFYDT